MLACSPCASQASRAARQSAQASKASTSKAKGRPSSTINCSGRLWLWSKKAVGRLAKALSDQAKLNSPKPTPNQGLASTSAQVLRQMLARAFGLSALMPFSAAARAPAPSVCWLSSPHQAMAAQAIR